MYAKIAILYLYYKDGKFIKRPARMNIFKRVQRSSIRSDVAIVKKEQSIVRRL
jgi:hypothetical protein